MVDRCTIVPPLILINLSDMRKHAESLPAGVRECGIDQAAADERRVNMAGSIPPSPPMIAAIPANTRPPLALAKMTSVDVIPLRAPQLPPTAIRPTRVILVPTVKARATIATGTITVALPNASTPPTIMPSGPPSTPSKTPESPIQPQSGNASDVSRYPSW